jgi:hypothetical protein
MSWFSAEECISDVLNYLVSNTVQASYDKKLEQKMYTFAAKIGMNAILAEVNLAWVSVDSGDKYMEELLDVQEPSMCQVDSFAKYAIPIRKPNQPAEAREKYSRTTGRVTLMREKSKKGLLTGMDEYLTAMTEGSSINGASSPVLGTSRAEKSIADRFGPPQIEKLPAREPCDPIEKALRDERERRIKRHQEELEEAKRKEIEELEKTKRLGMIREELRSKTFSHDANGNVVFVESLNVGKLPGMSAATLPKLRDDGPHRLGQVPDMTPAEVLMAMNKKSIDISETGDDDGFKSTATQAAIGTMLARPGVVAGDKGRILRGPEAKRLVDDPEILSRAEYLQMIYSMKSKDGTGKDVAE